jgi:hypothetical protein
VTALSSNGKRPNQSERWGKDGEPATYRYQHFPAQWLNRPGAFSGDTTGGILLPLDGHWVGNQRTFSCLLRLHDTHFHGLRKLRISAGSEAWKRNKGRRTAASGQGAKVQTERRNYARAYFFYFHQRVNVFLFSTSNQIDHIRPRLLLN